MILLALLALTQSVQAAVPATQAPLPPPGPGLVRVAIATGDGTIVLDLEQARAPITTAGFLRYVDRHRLDGTVFYRAVKVAPRFGFVQFGVQNAPARVLPPIAHEPSTQTGVKHGDGAISITRLAPGSARGDFTINLGEQPSLDADPSRAGDNAGYAAFGHVVAGVDVVERMLDAATGLDKPFPGENMVTPVKILSVRRVP